MPSTKVAPSRMDTVKFLTAIGRALGANVEIRTRPGRPPRPTPLEQLLPDVAPPVRRQRKLRPNPHSFRRRLARAKTEDEARAILKEMRELPRDRSYSPKWDEATTRRYLPAAFKHLAS